MVSLMTALWFAHLEAPDRVSVKPHASPVLHAINYLLGRLDPRYLTTLREFGGLQSYPSAHEGPRPGRLLDRLASASARPRRSGARSPTATSPGTSTCRVGGRQIALLGDAELDEGAVLGGDRRPDGGARWARCCGSSTSTASRSTASCPTSPPGASRRCSRPPAGTPRRSSTAGACARSSSATAARRCARASTRCPTRSTSGCCAPTTRELRERLPGGDAGDRAAHRRPRRRRAAGRLPRPRRPRPRRAARRLPRGRRGRATARRVVFAYTIKGWRLPTEGHPANHSALLTDEQFGELAAAARRRPARPVGAVRRRARRRPSCARAAARAAASASPSSAAEPPPVPADARPRAQRARARPSRRSGASSSTSRARRPRSPSAWSPSRPTSASSTNLGGWINQARHLEHRRPHRLVRRRHRHARALARVRPRPPHRARHRRGQPRRPARRARRDVVRATASRCCRSARSTTRSSRARSSRGRSASTPAASRSSSARRRGVTLGPEGGAHQSVDHAVDRHRAAGLRGVGAGLRPGPRVVVPARAGAARARRTAARPTSASRRARSTRRSRGAAEDATREQRRADVLAGGYRLRAGGPARGHRRRWARSCPRRSRRPSLRPRRLDAEVVCLTSADLRLPRAPGARRARPTATTRSSTRLFPRARARWSPCSTATRTRSPSWPACTARRSPASGCSAVRPVRATSPTSTAPRRSTPRRSSAPRST